MRHNATSRVALLCLVCAVSLALTGCSRVGLFYNGLPWFIPQYVDYYIDLDKPQKTQLEQLAAQSVDWHRETQLPRYADFLYQIGDDIAQGLDRTTIDEYRKTITGFWDGLIAYLTPYIVSILASFTDAQITQLKDFFEDRNKDFYEEYVAVDESSLRGTIADEVREQVREWFGEINNRQSKLVDEWSELYIPMSSATLAYRQRWQQQLFSALQNRHHPTQFSIEVSSLLRYPETVQGADLQEKREQNEELFIDYLLRLEKTLTSGQRAFLNRRLTGYADEFVNLSGQ